MTTKNKKRVSYYALGASLGVAASLTAQAADLSITVQNLTPSIYFTPLLVAAHDADTHLYQVGHSASLSLQMMAEGGDISALASDVMAAGGVAVSNPHQGLLNPGQMTASFTLDTGDHQYLSLSAMLLPTNDAFAGIDSWKIPSEPGHYHIYVNAYDAGTEPNNELMVPGAGAPSALGIPADPSGMTGTGGSGVTSEDANNMVHIHRGSLGDDDAQAGKSDLNNTVHRWLNPVLKVTVIVN